MKKLKRGKRTESEKKGYVANKIREEETKRRKWNAGVRGRRKLE